MAVALLAGPAAGLYTPRESAEESCRRVQELEPPFDDQTRRAPYDFGYTYSGGQLPESGAEITVDYGDGSPPGVISAKGLEGGYVQHVYTEPGEYYWSATGYSILMIPISPSEGNLPCRVPVRSKGVARVTPGPPGAVPATTPTTAAAELAARASSSQPAAPTECDSGGTSPWLLGGLALALAAGVGVAGRLAGWFGKGGPTPRLPELTVQEQQRLSAKEIDQIRTGDEAGRVRDKILGAGKDFTLDQLTAEAVKGLFGAGAAVAVEVVSGVVKTAETAGLAWELANMPHPDQRAHVEQMIRDGEIGKLEKAHPEMATYDLDQTETSAWLGKLSDLAHSQEAAEKVAQQQQAVRQLGQDMQETNKAVQEIKDRQAAFESSRYD